MLHSGRVAEGGNDVVALDHGEAFFENRWSPISRRQGIGRLLAGLGAPTGEYA